MKKYIIFGIVLLLVMVILVIAKKINIKTKTIDVTSFELTFSGGMVYNSGARYVYKDNTITYKKANYDDNKARTVIVDSSFKEELEHIIKEYDVISWDGFDKSDDMVMDGHSFTLNMVNNGKTIKAHGYMKYPKYYSIFQNRIIELFEKYGDNK